MFLKFWKFNRKTPVLESRFCKFVKNRLQRRCFTVKFVKFLRTPILGTTAYVIKAKAELLQLLLSQKYLRRAWLKSKQIQKKLMENTLFRNKYSNHPSWNWAALDLTNYCDSLFCQLTNNLFSNKHCKHPSWNWTPLNLIIFAASVIFGLFGNFVLKNISWKVYLCQMLCFLIFFNFVFPFKICLVKCVCFHW